MLLQDPAVLRHALCQVMASFQMFDPSVQHTDMSCTIAVPKGMLESCAHLEDGIVPHGLPGLAAIEDLVLAWELIICCVLARYHPPAPLFLPCARPQALSAHHRIPCATHGHADVSRACPCAAPGVKGMLASMQLTFAITPRQVTSGRQHRFPSLPAVF